MFGKVEQLNEEMKGEFSLVNEKLQEIFFPEIITKYSVLQKGNTDFDTYIIIRNEKKEFFRVMLKGLIYFKLGEKRCLSCGRRIDLEVSEKYCKGCIPEYEEKYKQCLFHSPKSIYSKKCVLGVEPCFEVENREKCFSKYYLYFGRFGETIKTGISKISIGQYKYRRIIEQGLNEAIVVYPFHSLSEVTNYERLLIDELGIEERITFEEKVKNLLQPSFIKIEQYYPIKQIKELFHNKKITKMDIYPDNPLENFLSASFKIKQEKNISELRGTITYTQGNIGIIKEYDKLTFFDISKTVGKEIVRSEEWW